MLADEFLGVNEQYYRAAMSTLTTEYGSFANYLHAMEIDSDTLERLRARLLG